MTLICWITYRCAADVEKTAQQAARTCGTEGFWANWSEVNMLFVHRGRNALIGLHMSDGLSVPSTQTSNSLKYLSVYSSVHQATATLRLMFPGSFSNRELFTRVNKCGSCFQSSRVVESVGGAETVVVQLLICFSSGSVCADMNSSSISAGSSKAGPHSSTSVH